MGSLQLGIGLLQQPFNAREALVAFDREMQRLALQRVVMGVEEGNRRRRLSEVTPRGLNKVALPPQLVRWHRRNAAVAKSNGLSTVSIGRGLFDRLGPAHVTDPGIAGVAPSASRTK